MAVQIDSQLQFVKGVGPRIAEALKAKGILTVDDLLHHLPFRYEDRANPMPLSSLEAGQMASVVGEVRGSTLLRTTRMPIFELTVGQNLATLKCMWFHGAYLKDKYQPGQDEEALTDLELEARVRQVKGALRGLPEGSCLYQYTRVMSGFDLPRQKRYGSEVTETFASDPLAHLEKTAAFRRIDLHWCLPLEPSKARAFERKPQENAVDTSRMLSDLEKTATLLQGHLGSSLGLWLLSKAEAFQFFSYLFNLEEWAGRDQLRTDTGVDRQIVKSPVAWHSDYVQVGKRHVQMFSVSPFGQPSEMDRISVTAERHSLRVIDDAAQSFGAVHKGKQLIRMKVPASK